MRLSQPGVSAATISFHDRDGAPEAARPQFQPHELDPSRKDPLQQQVRQDLTTARTPCSNRFVNGIATMAKPHAYDKTLPQQGLVRAMATQVYGRSACVMLPLCILREAFSMCPTEGHGANVPACIPACAPAAAAAAAVHINTPRICPYPVPPETKHAQQPRAPDEDMHTRDLLAASRAYESARASLPRSPDAAYELHYAHGLVLQVWRACACVLSLEACVPALRDRVDGAPQEWQHMRH